MTGYQRILQQSFRAVESASQFQFAVELVNSLVAFAAQHESRIQLLFAIGSGEPFAAVQLTWYQMMKRQGGVSSAQGAYSVFGPGRHCLQRLKVVASQVATAEQ